MARLIRAGLILIAACAACSAVREGTVETTSAPLRIGAPVFARGAPIHGSHGLAIDAKGHLLVASILGNEIVTMDRDSGAILARRDLTAIGAKPAPDDLVFGPDGSLYYTSLSTGYVTRIAPNGMLTSRFVAPGTDPIAFSRDGRLFVGLAFHGDGLYELDPKTLATVRTIVRNQPGERPLGYLDAFAFGADGRLYAPVWLRGQVVSIDVDTREVRVVASGLSAPTAVKFDSHGNLLVTTWGDGRVLRIANPTSPEPSAPELVAQLRPSLDNLVIDATDAIYVSNGADGSITRIVGHKVDPVSPGGMIMPGGVAVLNGSVFVADFHSLRRLSASSGRELEAHDTAPELSALGQPSTVSVDGPNLVLASYATNQVQVWDPVRRAVVESYRLAEPPLDAVRFQGDLVAAVRGKIVRIRTNDTILGSPDVVYPLGLAVSGDALFVGDWATGRIWKIDRNGRTIVASGLVHPEGLALDRAGGLLVVEADAGRLSRIDLATGAMRVVASGLALGLTGQPPAEAAHLTLSGVAVAPSGAIFVTGDKDDVLYRIAR